MRNLKIKYLPYKLDQNYGIPTGYTAKEIEDNLEAGIKCVFITSPTYEGKCSDIKNIARVCHEKGIPLIVDAAHGAHFGFGKQSANNIEAENAEYDSVPESAVTQGADIVIHSVHKTLPSMTQTALIHIRGNLVDREKVKRFLRIYQSSSPSYILMSSIDLCMKEMEEKGDNFIQKLLYYRNKIGRETKDCQLLKVVGHNILEDPAKVLISVQDSTMTGEQLYGILREEYRLQPEMAGENTVLAIISGWDTDDGIDRLIYALKQIDKNLVKESKKQKEILISLPTRKMNLSEAWDSEKELVPFDDSEGRVAAEFVNLYPPGIPIIVPGEVYTREIIENIKGYIYENLNVQGIIKEKGFLCVKQK
jgi:arginine/lysine/ornithine decarboxylase